MITDLFKDALKHYENNFGTAMAFALLLVFIFPFIFLQNINLEAGTASLDYSAATGDPIESLAAIAAIILFLLFYSVLTTLMIFAVRKDTVKIRTRHYLEQKVEVFSFRLFAFHAAFFILLFAFGSAATNIGLHPAIIGTFFLIVSVLLMFVPQSLAIDEEGIMSAVLASISFLGKNPKDAFFILSTGIIILAITGILEYELDYYLYIGHYLTPVLTLVFTVPFIECLKTTSYLEKYGLVGIKVKK